MHAYLSRDEVREDGTEKSKKVFVNLPTEVGATEAEEIGVEHLLRDVKDAAISTLSSEVGVWIWVDGSLHLAHRELAWQCYAWTDVPLHASACALAGHTTPPAPTML